MYSRTHGRSKQRNNTVPSMTTTAKFVVVVQAKKETNPASVLVNCKLLDLHQNVEALLSLN